MDKIFSTILENKKFMQKAFHESIDMIFYEFETNSGIKSLVVYISEIIKTETLDRDVINPFVLKSNKLSSYDPVQFEAIQKMFPISDVKEVIDLPTAVKSIVDGNAVFFFEGQAIGLSVSSRGWEKRTVQEPNTEMIVRGPREGFIEDIHINRSLLRKKIKNNHLVFEEMTIGKQTRTLVNVFYISGIVNEGVLELVRSRLAQINIDAIMDSGYLEEFIEDSHISPISTVFNSQKPDVIASKILEGRVGILCDGSPHALTVPFVFIETIQNTEDYYNRPYIATVARIIRLVALISTILLAPLYVAIETFHQEMIPSALLISMAGANKGTPLPSLVEAVLMLLVFEFLKESGARMPKTIGSAISVVGGLVLGDSAVKAGIISADLVIVIAFTAIAAFIVPAMNEVITVYRLFLVVLGGVMGLYGITAGVFAIIIHAASLESFGVPYLSPIAPFDMEGLKDFEIRYPIWSKKKRPEYIAKENKTRQS